VKKPLKILRLSNVKNAVVRTCASVELSALTFTARDRIVGVIIIVGAVGPKRTTMCRRMRNNGRIW
jgi:hypothetical protein